MLKKDIYAVDIAIEHAHCGQYRMVFDWHDYFTNRCLYNSLQKL